MTAYCRLTPPLTLSFHYAWSLVENAPEVDQWLVLLHDLCLLYLSTVLDRRLWLNQRLGGQSLFTSGLRGSIRLSNCCSNFHRSWSASELTVSWSDSWECSRSYLRSMISVDFSLRRFRRFLLHKPSIFRSSFRRSRSDGWISLARWMVLNHFKTPGLWAFVGGENS